MSDAPLRVLIVEDNISDAKLLERELQRGGLHFSLIRVETEPEFIAALEIEPDVVLCDWNLPQFNSLHVLILLQERWPDTPFILVSGSIGEEAAVNIIKLGASDYLLKDRLARLVPAVQQAIGKREVKASARRIAKDLEISERQLTEAQRLAKLGSWTWDSETGRVWWSDALYKLYGFEPGSISPSCDTFLERVHLDDRSIARQRSQAMMGGADGFPVDLRIVTADGRMIWVHSQVQVTRDPAGKIIRIEGIEQDITDRKQSEQALRDERDRLSILTATAPGVLYSFRQHPNGKVTFPYSAPAVINMFGFSPEELARDAEPIFKLIHPADLQRVLASISESARTLEPWWMTFRLCQPECDEKWLEGHSIPIRESDGSIIWHGFVTDITKRKQSEDVVRFQHALLRCQSEASPDGILIVGPDNTVLSFNKQFLKVWNLPEEMFSVKNDAVILEKVQKRTADPDTFVAGVTAIYADRNLSCQHEVNLADGRVLDRYSTPIRGENKEYLGRVWYFRDITDRKKAELSLRESEERYRQLINSLPEAVFISSGGRIVFCNPACLRLLGATRPAEILGRKPFELVHPDQQDLVRERHAKLIETDDSVPGIEIKVVRLDGRPVSVYAVAIPIIDRGENAILVAISDLTDRERSVAMLGSVWDSVNDAIVTCDHHRKIKSVNRATTTLFGHTETELIGQELRLLMPSPYQEKCEEFFANYMRTGITRMIGTVREVVGLKKDGTTFPCELTVTEFRLDGERHFTGVIRDITARKQLEEQYHQAQKLEAFGQLAGGVAHDFNNLLTVINGYSHILHSDLPATDPRKEFVESIQEAGERAAGLTAQLLAFSRKTIIAPKVLDLNELIEHLLKMLRRLIGEDISFATVLAPGNLRIKIDPGQCEQVFINLAVNARDAMPRGGCLTFETSHFKLEPGNPLAQKLKPGSYVRTCVSDTGTGIPPDVILRIFEPFFTTKEVGRGTGLGLATVYGIVMQAGGNISVESELGQGTKFTMLFPAISEPEATGQQFETQEFAPIGTETILLVEDEDALLKLTHKLLVSQGYRVIPTSNGPAALAALQNHTGEIDLLLTDVVLPGLSGRALAEEVQARKPSIRVLYMTGYTGDAILRYGVETATNALIQKPFTSLALARKVRETLDSTPAKVS